MHRETEKDGLGVLCTAAALDDVNHLDLGPDVMVEAPKARRLVDDWLGLIWDSNHQKYRDIGGCCNHCNLFPILKHI